MAELPWCVMVFVVIACQVHDADNVAVGATVVTVSSSCPDITYSLVSQVFSINGTSGVVKVADITDLDFETVKSYTLDFKATKTTVGSEDSGTVTVTITVTDVNEAPTFAEDMYTACLNKSSPGGTVMIHVTATDEDNDDMLSYSITDSSIFEFEPTTGKIKVKSGQTIGETPASYNLTLKANDDDSTPLTETTTVSIDVADPCPVATPPPTLLHQ